MVSKEKRVKNLLEQVLNELDTTPGIHIKPKDAMVMNPDVLSKMAAKSNIVIGEDDDVTMETEPDVDAYAIQQNAVNKIQEWASLDYNV
jgi:hypothetical protein